MMPFRGEVVDSGDLDLEAMDRAFLTESGALRACSASEFAAFSRDHVRLWAQARGRYLLPTKELVYWLNMGPLMRITLEDPNKILEVGAGMGDLAVFLGIRSTDSGVQTRRDMRLLYGMLGQAVTKPPKHVEKLDAIAAAKKYKPHTIVASWVTQAYRDGDAENRVGSCMYGPDEAHLLNLCKRYIFIGNEEVHKDKRILSMPHETHHPEGHVSRAADQSKNVVWIWQR